MREHKTKLAGYEMQIPLRLKSGKNCGKMIDLVSILLYN
jgi:hypothetical protein